ncbi:hypothetical protein [Pseudomonas putida]|jgi:hypothetical protein|uniref:hypothetical protein n=1 Tax=Pseudomonas sp. TR47 TaxID=3342639 RepID=UPI000C124E30|nr:hypothetical protein CR511_12045 [Pseudomonas putida]
MVTGKSINSVNRIIAHSHGAREMLFVIERDKVDQDAQARLAIAHLEEDGDSILPAVIGKISEFNARGKEIKRRDLPLIKKSVPQYRSWKDWHGQEHSGVQIRTMDVYPIDFVRPPMEHLSLSVINGKEYIATRRVKVDEPPAALVHLANLMLEFFQEFEIFDVERQRIAKVQARQLQWDLLPPGKYPWKSAEAIVKPYLAGLRASVQGVIEHRIREITRFEPDFFATGRGGYQGYFVFGFSTRGIYLLESSHLDNATYKFGEDWEVLSTLTKDEIINGDHEHQRFIHDKTWGRKIRQMLAYA